MFENFRTKTSLDSAAGLLNNSGMNLRGRIHNGVVVLDNPPSLPEGLEVVVVCPEVSARGAAMGDRVSFPLVRSARPGSVHLTNDRIAEILDEEDAAAGR